MSEIFKQLNINTHSAYFRILASTLSVTLIPLFLIYLFISVQTLNTVEEQSKFIDSQLQRCTKGT